MELTTFDSMMLIFISIIGFLLTIIPSVVWNKSIQGKTLDFKLIRKRKYYRLLSGFGAIMFLAASLELFPMEKELGYVFVELLAIIYCKHFIDPYFDTSILNDLEKQNVCLYLRPFNSDGRVSFGRSEPFEEMIIGELNNSVAQCYAVGNPGSCLPTIKSAFNIYASDAEWQSAVRKMSNDASVILMALGDTDGCKWEITHCKRKKLLGKVLLFIRDSEAIKLAKKRFGVVTDIRDVGNPYLAYYDERAQLWNMFEVSSKGEVKKVISQFVNSHSDIKKVKEHNNRNWKEIVAAKVSAPKWPFVLMTILNPFVLMRFNNWPRKYKILSVISFLMFLIIGFCIGDYLGDGDMDIVLVIGFLFILCWLIIFAIYSPNISRYNYNWGSESVFLRMNISCCLWVIALSGLQLLFGILSSRY